MDEGSKDKKNDLIDDHALGIRGGGGEVFAHTPVLANEVANGFRARSSASSVFVDATLGLGGHAQHILEALPESQIIGIDRDTRALALARDRLAGFGDRVRFVHARFGDLGAGLGTVRAVGGILADLGVSSMQLDDPDRGFSFRFEGKLDMRMDETASEASVAEFLEMASVEELIILFRRNGVGSLAPRYAKAIKAHLPLLTTTELAELIVTVTPARMRGGRIHPATKVFQALRMTVNDEAGELERFLPAALNLLDNGGVLQVISYHSGEDRLVKRFVRLVETGGCLCPPRIGCTCGASSAGERVTRSAVIVTPEERERNPRARSARLRAIRRTARDVSDVIDRYWQQVPAWHE